MTETEKQKDIYILGIESSCDETAASVVKNGREVLSNVISSQIALHTLYGGVVPEIASRKHVEAIAGLADQALARAGRGLYTGDASRPPGGPMGMGLTFAHQTARRHGGTLELSNTGRGARAALPLPL